MSFSETFAPLSIFMPPVRGLARRFRPVSAKRSLFLYDMAATAGSLVVANMLVNEAAPLQSTLFGWAALAAAVASVLLPTFGVYSAYLRHSSVTELARLTASGLVITVLLGLLVVLDTSEILRTDTLAVFFLVLMPALGVPRILYRREDFRALGPGTLRPSREEADAERVLLVGNGASCDLFLRSLRQSAAARYVPVGIIDDVQGTQGSYLHSIPILGSTQDTGRVRSDVEAGRLRIDRVVLTEPLTRGGTENLTGFLDWAREQFIAVSQLPPLSALQPLEGGGKLADLDVSELLDRPQAKIDYALIRRMIAGRKVLVTGAGGSIGSELVRQIASLDPSELILIENCELHHYQIEMDLAQHFPNVKRRVYICCIRDADRLREIFHDHRPELVFNAAALKHVPIVEANPCEGVLTNVIGTRNVADLSREIGALAMVQISTDKAVNTTSVMGATKRVAEFYCQALDKLGGTRFMTVRFGNVLGSSGSLIPLFQRQIAEGGPLTVTDPRMTRFFMTIREAVELTLLASASAIERKLGQGRIFVLDMGEPIRIIDIARRIIALAGLRPGRDIEIEVIGVRPGEKLFEELFDAAEERRPSGIEGIRAAVAEGPPLHDLRLAITALEFAAHRGQGERVVEGLTSVVPGYSPATTEVPPEAAQVTPKLQPRVKLAETAASALVSGRMEVAR